MHAIYRLDTVPDDELMLSKILTASAPTREISALIDCELSGQVNHYLQTGKFPDNQKEFAIDYLIKKGWTIVNAEY